MLYNLIAKYNKNISNFILPIDIDPPMSKPSHHSHPPQQIESLSQVKPVKSSQQTQEQLHQEYKNDIRQKYVNQQNKFMKLVIAKAIGFGLLFAIVVVGLVYGKLIDKKHFYQPKKIDFATKQQQLLTKQQQLVNELQQLAKAQKKLQSAQKPSLKKHIPTSSQQPIKLIKPIKHDYHEINQINLKDKYHLQDAYRKVIIGKDLQKLQINQYNLAQQLLEVNHNVNFKGEVITEKTMLEPKDQHMVVKKKRIQKILMMEKERYQKTYQISKYIKHQLPFCLVIPSYNNAKSRLYLRNLDSIFQQQYSNYHIVYIDDASPDLTSQYVQKYISQHEIPSQKIIVIRNEQNLMALANIYNGITNYCKSGQIVMMLDGDDSLLGRQVMSTFNAVYQKHRAGLVYSKYFSISGNRWGGIGGSSRQIPQSYLQKDQFRKLRGFFTSHLLTFYADLFWKIDKKDLTYDNGTFFDFAYDVAIITPIIQMVNPRIVFLKQTNYQYRFDTGINDPGWGQIKVDNIVFAKPAYKRLTQFPFIDNFYKQIDTSPKYGY